MKIQALKFIPSSSSVILQQSELEVGSAQDLERLRDDTLPVVYLVKQEDLSPLRELNGLIFDRGIKNKHKGLSEYLLGLTDDKIYLIDGNYTASGQLKRGIRTFLSKVKVAESGTQNLYIIGAKKDIFDELWQSAPEPSEGAAYKDSEGSSCSYPDIDEADEPTCELLNDLVERCKVPRELADAFVGMSWKVDLVRKFIMLAAQRSVPVLILGDTGTGKEIVALQIHEYGRRNKPYKVINCGGIPKELFESELFGFRKGAFTGALEDRAGLWEDAGDGTLFLDEIGDLPLDQQAKILRALEDKKIRRLGETEDRPVYARVIAATNKDISNMVQRGQFREDLYYRLSGFPINTPALKDHPDDIPLLANHFWKKITKDDTKVLPEVITDELKLYRWPGNARELKMVLNNLFSIFGADRLSKKNLGQVFLIRGQSWISQTVQPSERGIDLVIGDCWRHLRRTDDVIRSLHYALGRAMGEKNKDRDDIASVTPYLEFYLGVLDILCREHMLFHSKETFSAVERFKDLLKHFHDLLHKDISEAKIYWQETLAHEFEAILSVIFKEGERVLGKG